MTGNFSSIYMSRNRVRSWDEPSFTIQAGGRHAPIHPDAPKMIKIGKDKMKPFTAACAGVWIHGDLAKQFGSGLIAEDIIKAIPHTLEKLKKWKTYVKKKQ